MSESVTVVVFDGKVVAKWHEPVDQIVFDPKNSYSVGMALCRAAMEAHQGKTTGKELEFIEGELKQVKIKVTDGMREIMIGEIATILRTKIPGLEMVNSIYIASHCVDPVLRETAR